MAQVDDELASNPSARLQSLHAEMLAAGDYERIAREAMVLEGLEALPQLCAAVEGIRVELAGKLDAIGVPPRDNGTWGEIASELGEKLEGLASLAQLIESVEGLQEAADRLAIDPHLQTLSKEVENAASGIHSLASELQYLASTVEEQGELTRMTIASRANNIEWLLRLLVLAAILMIVRFWPSAGWPSGQHLFGGSG
ncbi:hypothetical protein [Sphingomonas sp.]|uniref:hypothetical protein n=1 Tax=Sphingomonas sp. TaxID=28214 RepID=UPI0025D96A98|nr:hypothetical protein [Sphingomonas sp.]